MTIPFILPARIFISLFFSFFLSGCAILVIGTAGVAGGYAISNDGIEGIKDWNYKDTWETAKRVLSGYGVIEKIDEKYGTLIAKSEGSTVRFDIEQATPKSIVFRVRARRVWRMFPNMKLSRRIYSTILNEMGEKTSESK